MASQIKHKHGDNTECVSYLRKEGYIDIRDDQCCVCYFTGEKCKELDKDAQTTTSDEHLPMV